MPGKLGWLDISKWPANKHALELHGVEDLKVVFEHWQHRFPSMTWATVKAEFDQMKALDSSEAQFPGVFEAYYLYQKSVSMSPCFAVVLPCIGTRGCSC